ncbi:MAG TPA: polyphenol oxidase family protein [Acidimicrobiales bacterium]|nr:polyphenol oxidase family protein [Acidimicrobiales bacterium]
MFCGGVQAGDFSGLPPKALEDKFGPRSRRVTWLQQVHGADVATVRSPGDAAGATADAAVTDDASARLLVRTADCAPVGLGSPQGVAGVAHVGWKGLVAGVLQATVREMRRLGATEIEAAIGPCIHAACYEFSQSDLDLVSESVGGAVVARTSQGAPALDLVSGVRSVLERCGAPTVAVSATCTHCSLAHWSWRARRDIGRQATVVWCDRDGGQATGGVPPCTG